MMARGAGQPTAARTVGTCFVAGLRIDRRAADRFALLEAARSAG